MSSSTKILTQYLNDVIVASKRGLKKLWVFDFDDTLVKTDAVVHVMNVSGKKFDLTPGEFAVYEKQPGDVFDYTDFQKLINPRSIKWVNKILHNVYVHHKPEEIIILSARCSAEPIKQFLREASLHDIEVVALNNADPNVKASWIKKRVERDSYDIVEYFDDSHKNVAAVNNLRHQLPDVMIIARHIVHNRISSLHSTIV